MLKPVENRRYWFVVVVQVFLFFVAPFTREHPSLLLLLILGLFGVFGIVIHTIWKVRLPRFFAISAAAVALGTRVMAFPELRFDEPNIPYLMACSVACAAFILIAIISIGADVLFRESVTLDSIWGSISIYMFLGMFFAFLFGFLAFLIPEAFDYAGKGGSLGRLRINDLLYFSYATLTTTGYGDILPVHPFVRTLAILESIVGTLYIVVMISRLVGLHVAKKGHG